MSKYNPLLIEPFGIEIECNAMSLRLGYFLLIEPFGIEIRQMIHYLLDH